MFESKINLKLHIGVLLTILFLSPVLTITVQAQSVEVVAQKGEGIYRLLARNGLAASQYMNVFIELNKDLLGRNNALYAGRKYKLLDTQAVGIVVAGKCVVNYDIFGKEYANV